MLSDVQENDASMDSNLKVLADLAANSFTVDPKQLRQLENEELNRKEHKRRLMYNAIVQVEVYSKPSVLQESGHRPAVSYITLIRSALLSVPEQKMKLGQIYKWIMQNYPFYKTARIAWKNSVRHALSASKQFYRINEEPYAIRGGYWALSNSLNSDSDGGDDEDKYCCRDKNLIPYATQNSISPEKSSSTSFSGQVADFQQNFPDNEPDPFCFVGENSFCNSEASSLPIIDMPELEFN